jgi:hypothetical protein
MRLDQWTRIGELIGTVVIVVSLIVLIVQVRESTELTKRQIIRDRSEMLNMPFVHSPRVYGQISAKINLKGGFAPFQALLMDEYGLTPEEAIVWNRHMIAAWGVLASDFEYSGVKADLEPIVTNYLRWEDTAKFWEVSGRTMYSERFVNYVESFRDE